MDNDHRVTWENFLNPDVLRPSLMLASIFIATYEILKDSIIGRIRDFYVLGFDGTKEIIDPEYTTEVLSKNKSPLYASLEWLKEIKAITNDDSEEKSRYYFNEFMKEFPKSDSAS